MIIFRAEEIVVFSQKCLYKTRKNCYRNSRAVLVDIPRNYLVRSPIEFTEKRRCTGTTHRLISSSVVEFPIFLLPNTIAAKRAKYDQLEILCSIDYETKVLNFIYWWSLISTFPKKLHRWSSLWKVIDIKNKPTTQLRTFEQNIQLSISPLTVEQRGKHRLCNSERKIFLPFPT